MIRDIVSIDEELCNGCGECVPSCAEGAIEIIDGKARLVSDALCDGLGVCLGHCPQGAIRIDQRVAMPYDEAQVRDRVSGQQTSPVGSCPRSGGADFRTEAVGPAHGGEGVCPSSQVQEFSRHPQAGGAWSGTGSNREGAGASSALTHWPVQLRLLPPAASALRGARLLITSDCVPVAYADFHADLLRGRAVVMACPKLDDTGGYVEKLTEMIRQNDLVDITVARMEVPCCSGIVHMVQQARQRAGKDVPVTEVLISIRGQVLDRREISTEPVVSS